MPESKLTLYLLMSPVDVVIIEYFSLQLLSAVSKLNVGRLEFSSGVELKLMLKS